MLTDKKFTFRIRSVLKLQRDAGTANVKGRDFHALSIRVEGGSDISSGGESFNIGSGDMLYIPAGCDFSMNTREHETVIAVHFDILDADFHAMEAFKTKNPEIMIDLFYKMYRAWRAKAVGYEYRIDSLMSRVLEGMEIGRAHV